MRGCRTRLLWKGPGVVKKKLSQEWSLTGTRETLRTKHLVQGLLLSLVHRRAPDPRQRSAGRSRELLRLQGDFANTLHLLLKDDPSGLTHRFVRLPHNLLLVFLSCKLWILVNEVPVRLLGPPNCLTVTL